MPALTQEQMTALINEIAAGTASFEPIRAELVMLGKMVKQIEPQMGSNGKPSLETMVSVWGRMAVAGDADAKQVLESLKDHPAQGKAASGWLAQA